MNGCSAKVLGPLWFLGMWLMALAPPLEAAGTVTISKFLFVVDGQEDATSPGCAVPGLPVTVKCEASCDCGCPPNLKYTWYFGDGCPSFVGEATQDHAYAAGDEDCEIDVQVECQNCLAWNRKRWLWVSILEGIEHGTVGSAYRLCFNCETVTNRQVTANVYPECCQNEGNPKIDHLLTVGSYDIVVSDAATAVLNLPAGNWPASNSVWGGRTLVSSINSPSIGRDRSELVTGCYSFLETDTEVSALFDKYGADNPDGDANWYYYWASDNGGPNQHRNTGTTTHYGATITWLYNPGLAIRAQITWNPATPAVCTVEFGPSCPNATNWDFTSPRVPAAGTFLNSQGDPTSFPAGNITLSFGRPEWRGIDVVEHAAEHEKCHLETFRKWEPGYPWRTAYGARTTGPGGNDRDGDWLPNRVEDTFGTRWDVFRTFAGFYVGGGDDEVYCEKHAGNQDLDGTSDWAHVGKQWH